MEEKESEREFNRYENKFEIFRAEIRHLRELLLERDKALQMQARFYEQEKADLDSKVDKLIEKNNRMMGWIAGVAFLGGLIIIIINYFKK